MEPLRRIVNQVMEGVQDQVGGERPAEPGNNGGGATRHSIRSDNPSPLRSGGFTSIPRVLDDFILRLSRHEPTRAIARVLWLVVMDLARYTDNARHDVVVTNQGIAERRGVGLPNVKAAIWILKKLRVVRKEDPSAERLQELKRNKVRFTTKRRRLVWNAQEQWILLETAEELDQITALWNEYVGKGKRYS